jgi:hypothetical protein
MDKSPEGIDKINYIAKRIDELQEKIAGIEESLKKHDSILENCQQMIERFIDNLSLVLVLDYGMRQSKGFPESELEEVKRLAREERISVAEMVKRLEIQGTLPPSIKNVKDAVQLLKEMLKGQ